MTRRARYSRGVVDRAHLLPYVVPSSYPIDRAAARPLGHDVWLVLVNSVRNLVHPIPSADVDDDAWRAAFDNIDRVFGDRIMAMRYDGNPGEGLPPLILCGGHALASSCVVMPRLFAWASAALGERELLVSIPTRSALHVFPRSDAAGRAAMRAKIRAAETGRDKPITWELFTLAETGLAPFHEP